MLETVKVSWIHPRIICEFPIYQTPAEKVRRVLATMNQFICPIYFRCQNVLL